MKNRLIGSVAVVGLLAVATPATAAPSSTVEPVPDVNATVPAGPLCPFEISVETLVNTEKLRTFFDAQGDPTVALLSGRLIWRFTNTETGASIVRNLSGPGRTIFHEDGTRTEIFLGRSAIAFFLGDPLGPSALIVSGPAILEYDADGDLVSADIRGHITEDVCETLA